MRRDPSNITLDEAESLIKRGDQVTAWALLRRLGHDDAVARRDVLRFSNLLGRVGEVRAALQALTPFVFDDLGRLRWNPEMAEYCRLLSRFGGAITVMRLLDDAPPAEHVLRARFTAAMACWRPSRALEDSTRLIRETAQNPYEASVSAVNHAHVLGMLRRYEEARDLLGPLVETLRAQGHRLLHVNACCLLSIAEAEMGRASRARLAFKGAEESQKCLVHVDRLFLARARVVIALRFESRAAFRRALKELRSMGEGLHHLPTLLECNRLEAIGEGSHESAAKSYFATASAEFRRILREDFAGAGTELPEEWILGSKRKHLCASTGCGVGVTLKLGQMPHRILNAFASEPFKRFPWFGLIGHLYDDARLNLNTSRLAARNAIQRTRARLSEAAMHDCIVEATPGVFFWNLDVCGLHFRRAAESAPPTGVASSAWRSRLESKFGATSFTSRKIALAFGLSDRSAQRLLRTAREEGWIESREKGDYRMTGLALPS